MMVLALIVQTLIAAFATEEALAIGLLAAIAASTAQAYLWAAPSFVVDGTLIGGSVEALLWLGLQLLRETGR